MARVVAIEDLALERLVQPEGRAETQHDPGLVLAKRVQLDVVFPRRL